MDAHLSFIVHRLSSTLIVPSIPDTQYLAKGTLPWRNRTLAKTSHS